MAAHEILHPALDQATTDTELCSSGSSHCCQAARVPKASKAEVVWATEYNQEPVVLMSHTAKLNRAWIATANFPGQCRSIKNLTLPDQIVNN